ncbi:MAG: hypothetical protein COU90_00415 [Candidatus Ryanbacteria bacterium CG10_big_fil_rev_8_21_14_0_10_43_42]|uniref:Uncharacterized protein n=1 Tax=Candidatus Ryanbacteria bacterium CG10_big_fil_rev_8_21_14_0_10_43_42 TaxID=1974864 RepID=A0A2M8KXR3_9BACT|nr:MAG: hypothetical protein COU90_00415 [Candidatus Ryanbacteria bacterium CG10_big_fil_rev_8_21_14_0_10_43_42]
MDRMSIIPENIPLRGQRAFARCPSKGVAGEGLLSGKESNMQKQQENPQPQRKPTWEELVKEQPDLIRRYNKLRNRLRLAFRPAQQEAYESWCTWETSMEIPQEARIKIVP